MKEKEWTVKRQSLCDQSMTVRYAHAAHGSRNLYFFLTSFFFILCPGLCNYRPLTRQPKVGPGQDEEWKISKKEDLAIQSWRLSAVRMARNLCLCGMPL
jgi:hypothetical protein